MSLIQCNFYADTLERTVTFNAIIPTDKTLFSNHEKPEKKKPLKTLYLLHGGLGNYSDWLGGTRIQVWAQDNDLAVIMPSGDNRWYLDDPEESGMFGNYSQFIGKELIQFTRETFPLSHKREDTFIGGLSMGGFGAIVNGIRWHETFSCIGALSPGLMLADLLKGYDYEKKEDMRKYFGETYYKNLERLFGEKEKVRGSYKDYKASVRKLRDKGTEIPAIYLACGKKDFIIDRSRDFHQYLQEINVSHTYEEGEGAHDWQFWDTFIEKYLNWLPLDKKAVAGKHSGNVNEISANSSK